MISKKRINMREEIEDLRYEEEIEIFQIDEIVESLPGTDAYYKDIEDEVRKDLNQDEKSRSIQG